MEKLKQRRMAQAQERERARLRDKNGAAIVNAVAEILGPECSQGVAVYDMDSCPKASVAERIEQSPGLVAPYVGYARARQILSCCQAVLGGQISATLWLDEKNYMGPFACRRLVLPQLADLAMKLEDRVVVAPLAASGILIVDYYAQTWTAKQTDFSVIVQGPDIESTFEKCFALQSPLHTRLVGRRD
ncbi:MAG TPA: hypothetical protein VFA39_02720 [Steroidobacteraceae bacterium]|nr:hypothetical protein [Steroidobacteraceae bacterium]